MDAIISLHKSVVGETVKEESKPSESNGDEESCVEEIVFHQVAAKKGQENDGIIPPSHKNLSCSKQLDDQLGLIKEEMDEVMEENQRLKTYLDRVLKDYRTLEMQYRDVIQHDQTKDTSYEHAGTSENEQIDLTLGIGEAYKKTKIDYIQGRELNQGLSLGFDCKFDFPQKSPLERSPNRVVEEVREEGGETGGFKGVKNVREGGDDDEILHQNPTKRARVAVRVRCDTPTMNDGCQWRKYGQKIAKGNPCPRAYYRCTVAPSCPVRKQVQRCMDDMSILITTYEGTHNHPLPISATAMASTTSAAASMLIAGSSTSGTGPIPSSTTADLNSLSFYLSTSKPDYYLPNPSISSSPSFPTITLDFTSSSSSSSHLNRFVPRYPTTNLNFSYLESNPLPVSYSNAMLCYGPEPPNKTQTATSLCFGSQQYESQYKKTIPNPNPNPNQQSLGPDTIAAATKAITSNPNFQSVLAAALTSIIGGSGGGASSGTFANQSVGEKSSARSSKASDPFPIISGFPCPVNKSSSSMSSLPAGLTLLSPPFPFSNVGESKSNLPGDHNIQGSRSLN